MKKLLYLLPLLTLAGCISSGVILTRQHLDAYGTRVYSASHRKVFRAAVAALKAQGYPIVFRDRRAGIIKTGQKLIRTYTWTEARKYRLIFKRESAISNTVRVLRRYTVKLRGANGRIAVTALPTVFIGSKDISAKSVWDIDGPEGERVLWNQLFNEIASMLPR